MRIQALIVCSVIFCASSAAAHEWYDAYCCNKRDCHEESGEVVSTPEGYLVKRLGETVKYGSNKIRRSQDKNFHVCEYSQSYNGSVVRCLYFPGGDV